MFDDFGALLFRFGHAGMQVGLGRCFDQIDTRLSLREVGGAVIIGLALLMIDGRLVRKLFARR